MKPDVISTDVAEEIDEHRRERAQLDDGDECRDLLRRQPSRSSPINFSARIRWPVLLMGMNSVSP